MMKSGVPWSIRGIDDDIREAARAAARRSGVSVSEWLNDLIAEQAAADRATPRRSHHDKDDGGFYPEADAVTDAVQSLTRRIRAMDENSRAALSGLQDRLDEIEDYLGVAARAGGRSTERARSLKGVATIVDELSREMDNADETARSSVEGLRKRAPAKNEGRGAGIDRVAEAIRNLDARLSSISEPARPSEVGEPPVKLDMIKAHLDTLLARTPGQPTSGGNPLDATLRSLESHIDQAKSRLVASVRQPKPRSMTSDEEDRARRIEKSLAEITTGISAQRASGRSDDDFSSVVAEISARQRSIDERADYAAFAREQQKSTESLAELRADVAALSDKITAAEHDEPEDNEPYLKLAERIDALAAELPLDRNLLSAIHADLESVRAALDDDAGADRIAGRVSESIRRMPEIERLDAVGEEVAAIRQALDGADGPRAIARLEMRVAELARGMEAALNASNANNAASGRRENEAIDRLESRLEAIATNIDSFLGRAAPIDAIGELHERFATVLERLDEMRATRDEPVAALDDIKSEIAGIRREIAEREPVNIDHVERQIAELAERLESVTASEPDGPALAELEAQVAHLASELERSMPRTSTLKQVEENLARLQGYLSENREESVEAARSAARDAVREFAQPQGDSDLVRALKDDLENIRAAAGDSDQRTQETLGSVHDTLARVVDRLTRLESENESEAESAREPVQATGTYGVGAPVPRAEPAAAIGGALGSLRIPDDNRPLEPGTGKPDLAALRELARSATDARREGKSDRRADFIAAARRAAQAAAAEAAEDAEEEVIDDGKPGAFARIGQAIRSRKRPLLLAAAALVLAISAIQLFGEGRLAAPETSPKVALITPDTAGEPFRSPATRPAVAKVQEAPIVTQVGGAALVAPPPDVRTDIAFAAPEAVDSRFGAYPAAPSAIGFEPRSGGEASAPVGSVMESGDTAMSPGVLALETGIGPEKLRQAAAAGDPTAAFEVAARYAEGKAVSRDFAKAAEWYGRAAEAGIAVAQYRLGSLYERGQGIDKDLVAAATWYQRAADQGNIGAMHNLAVMMSEGVDGPPDHDKAFEWFLAASNYGVKDSQYNLGVIYARGLGPDQDLVESYKWFALAAASGDAEASARRDEVGKALSPDDLARARAVVKVWRATSGIPDANTVATPAGGWDGAFQGVSEVDRRSLVTKIQTILAAQGYDPGPADGFEGPQTREAVRAFQRTVGLVATGTINGDLVTALVSPST